eukprot:g35375.t1
MAHLTSCKPEGGCFWEAVDCDDHDECTKDSCDPEHGCVHEYICHKPSWSDPSSKDSSNDEASWGGSSSSSSDSSSSSSAIPPAARPTMMRLRGVRRLPPRAPSKRCSARSSSVCSPAWLVTITPAARQDD